MKGIDALREAVWSVTTPGAPPRLSRQGAVVGLAFLETALRRPHIRRLTERITIVDHGTARCTTELGVSLGLLDEEQRHAGRLYQRLRAGGLAPVDYPGEVPGGEASGELLWVPISRVLRDSASPIEVSDGNGDQVPRLTQYETASLLASALYRLLRGVLSTHPHARERRESPLSNFLHRDHAARWLVQAALISLLTERRRPTVQTVPSIRGGRVPEDASIRRRALAILDEFAPKMPGYTALLDIAVNERLLIVGLDARRDEHIITYDSPLHCGDPRRRSWLWRQIRLAGGTYQVHYSTRLPSNLRSYHLVAETDSSLQIAGLSVSGDADRTAVESLRRDLVTLAGGLGQVTSGGDGTRRAMELELSTCLRSLSELMRHRRWEAHHAGMELPDKLLGATNALTLAYNESEAGRMSAEEALTLAGHAGVTEAALRGAARELEVLQLDRDLTVYTDRPTERAHVYSRKDPAAVNSERTFTVSSTIFVRDASSEHRGTVVTYVVSVVGISYLLGCLMFRSWVPFDGHDATPVSNADAVVAVLLLVPGFLYTRLNLPSRRSVAGQLRTLPRLVAHLAIGSAAVLGAMIASGADDWLVRVALAGCMAIPTGAAVAMSALSRFVHRLAVPADPQLPAWAKKALRFRRGPGSRLKRSSMVGRWLRILFAAPDVSYTNAGDQS